MKYIVIHIFSILWLLSMSICTITAQKPYQPRIDDPITESWRWTYISQLHGKSIRCISQSQDGDMLFGITNGVMKYNGYSWELLSPSDSSMELSITTLCDGEDGTIYVGTTTGLYSIKDREWEKLFPIKAQPEVWVSDLIRLPEGSILASFGDSRNEETISGLLRLKKDASTLYTTQHTYNDELKKEIDSLNWFRIPDKLGLANRNGKIVFNILDLCAAADGNIFAAVSNEHQFGKIVSFNFDQGINGAFRINDLYTEREGLLIRSKVKISEAPDGKLWVASNAHDLGIYLLSDQKWTSFKISDQFGGVNSQNDILTCSDGSVWIEGHGRIFLLKNNKLHQYKYPEIPITTAPRFQFFESEDHAVWVLGKLDEVFRFDNTFETWITYEELNYQGSSRDGRSWFLTADGKIVTSQYGEWMAFDEKDGVIDTPVRIFITSYDEVWVVGSHEQNAATAYLEDQKWIKKLHPKVSWGIDSRSVFESKDGSLWFGCSVDLQLEKGHLGGVLQLKNPQQNKDTWIHHGGSEDLEIRSCYGIGQSEDGRIWFGGKPLWTYDGTKWKIFDDINELQEYVDYIHNDTQGNLWLASRYYGIFKTDGDHWDNYTVEDGLPSNNILSIMLENDSSVWANTHGGLSHFDGYSWTGGGYANDLSMAQGGSSVIGSNSGHLWFNISTNDWKRRGLTNDQTVPNAYIAFKTVRYFPDENPPETEILPFDTEIEYNSSFTIFWQGHDYFEITNSKDLLFSWRLNGKEWSKFTPNTYHNFSNLKPGSYQLEVRARDLEFNVDLSPSITSFQVDVPWWRRLEVLILALTALTIIGILQYNIFNRNRRLQELNIDLRDKSEELQRQKMETESKKIMLEETLAKLQKLNQSRLKFFTNVSHEFRTPLGLIIGPAEELIETPGRIGNELKSKYYDIILRNAKRILRLVNQILEVYKVEASTLDFHPERGDIVQQIKRIVELFDSLSKNRKVDLIVDASPESITFFYDHDKVEKILFNLLSNAFKSVSEDGYIHVILRIQSIENQESGLETKQAFLLEVKDNGKGIPKESLPKIFDRFFHSEHESDSKLHTGAGIGLSYIKDLVKTHKGTISVTSEPLSETIFKVHLPFIQECNQKNTKDSHASQLTFSEDIYSAVSDLSKSLTRETKKLPVPDNEEPSHEIYKELKLLIIDDDLDTRIFLRSCFNDNYQVLEANNGKMGLTITRTEFPDLIISDVMMPIMNGIELCKILKTDFDTSHIPIILLTAKTLTEDKIEGLETGANAYLEKPFNKRVLVTQVQNLIRERENYKKRFQSDVDLDTKELKISSIDENFIQKVINCIEDHMDDSLLNAEQIAKSIGVSRIQLYRKIKALTSQTVNQFIKSVRLKNAAKLLLESDLTISEIAYESGFSAPSHFATYFKEYFGITASEYIEKRNKGIH
jgi:signal transduction histidine kinase/DNA-binding response OmpR family regulator